METARNLAVSLDSSSSYTRANRRGRSHDSRRCTTPHIHNYKLIFIFKQVVEHTPSLPSDQLVSVTQYHPGNKIGPPLAVGRMALPSDEIREDGKKGKAVFVLHTWKDSLWELGGGGDVPEVRGTAEGGGTEMEGKEQVDQGAQDARSSGGTDVTALVEGEAPPEASVSTLSPQSKHALEFLPQQTPNVVFARQRSDLNPAYLPSPINIHDPF
jgi:hypothetical protein